MKACCSAKRKIRPTESAARSPNKVSILSLVCNPNTYPWICRARLERHLPVGELGVPRRTEEGPGYEPRKSHHNDAEREKEQRSATYDTSTGVRSRLSNINPCLSKPRSVYGCPLPPPPHPREVTKQGGTPRTAQNTQPMLRFGWNQWPPRSQEV